MLTYTGPLGFIQLLETPFLNLLGFASLVATNASRMVKAVHPKQCIEFGSRRAQGPDGALSAAQYSFLGGFSGTSNVQAGSKLGIKCVGTMSHAYITSFSSLKDVKPFYLNKIDIIKLTLEKKAELGLKSHEGELASFLNFAQAFPDNFVTLVDTYSTLESGMINTILIAGALMKAGIFKIGIRLDSGDLGELSRECRALWKYHYPEHELTIVASDDLYEERLIEIEALGSEIDIYAIGTNIATCKKQPALGLVCKLVELKRIPKMKLSSTPEKATYPAVKSVYRVTTITEHQFDVIALNEEVIKKGDEIALGNVGKEISKHIVEKI